ncbi:MAG TPA: hypothetical protein PLJ47_03765 [Candidatus Hydrogenedentes bacterium]|nr:hypothetical protein [Candidatus Hydrogenedentota bacterium]
MPLLVVACPGDAPVAGAKHVFLLDGRSYPKRFFEAHFDEIHLGAGVEQIDESGEIVLRLNADGVNRLAAINSAPVQTLFAMSSDTHVKTFMPVAAHFANPRHFVYFGDDSLAIKSLEAEGASWERHSARMRGWHGADVMITGNDWGTQSKLIVARARKRRIPSVIVQESIIDLDHPMGMMQWADFAIIQGPYSLRYLKRDFAFLAGNPRYDAIQRMSLPDAPRAFINCNFTFNVFEDKGRGWVDDVTRAAEAAGLPYMVSLHPRCYIDMTGVKNVQPSGAYVVHEQLRASTIVITRFSSLAHEALLMGRHVIYYNPHGETMRYLNEDATGLIEKAYNPIELAAAIRRCMSQPAPIDREISASAAFDNLFCGTEGLGCARCATAIRAIAATRDLYLPRDFRYTPEWKLRVKIFLDESLRRAVKRVPLLSTVRKGAKRLVGR